ncbi:MAG: ATP-binding cassette domain-containing protein [bacterium]|nr:ATP-binding cassette domain-containing protein [bacterium]
MIDIKNITFSYGEKQILKNFSIKISDTDRICFSGPSGCGKTTLARLLIGLEKVESGKIRYLPPNPRFSTVFQEDRLISNLTVLENVALSGDKEKARELLTVLGLKEQINEYPDTLSGGMCRKVSVARALCYDGDILILDEAFNGIDHDGREHVAKLILQHFAKKTIIMISHIKTDAQLLDAKLVELDKCCRV